MRRMGSALARSASLRFRVAGLRRHRAPASGAGLEAREQRGGHADGRRSEAAPHRSFEQQVGVAVSLTQTAQDLDRRRGDDGVHGQCDEAQPGRQAVQHRVEAAGLRLVLGQLPRRLFFDQAVEAADKVLQDVAAEGEAMVRASSARYDADEVTAALESIWEYVRRLNRLVEEEAPWKLAKDEAQAGRLDAVLHGLAAGLRLVALAVYPVVPATAVEILRRLGQAHADADLLLES